MQTWKLATPSTTVMIYTYRDPRSGTHHAGILVSPAVIGPHATDTPSTCSYLGPFASMEGADEVAATAARTYAHLMGIDAPEGLPVPTGRV